MFKHVNNLLNHLSYHDALIVALHDYPQNVVNYIIGGKPAQIVVQKKDHT